MLIITEVNRCRSTRGVTIGGVYNESMTLHSNLSIWKTRIPPQFYNSRSSDRNSDVLNTFAIEQ